MWRKLLKIRASPNLLLTMCMSHYLVQEARSGWHRSLSHGWIKGEWVVGPAGHCNPKRSCGSRGGVRVVERESSVSRPVADQSDSQFWCEANRVTVCAT